MRVLISGTQMNDAVKELEAEVKKEIKFVKYHFADMQGNLKEVTLTEKEIKGIGISSVDGSSAFGKIVPPTESDMVLVPDISTLHHIPWSESEDVARVNCNIYLPPNKEGDELVPFGGDGRSILKKVMKQTNEVLAPLFFKETIEKFHVHFAPEVEFVLVPQEYDYLNIHKDKNLGNNHYFTAPSQKVDNTLKAITKYLGKMGLVKEKYHTEVSDFQYEIGISYGNALDIADGVITLKYIIQTVALNYGFRASFIPKYNNRLNGTGMHVHQNLAATINGEKQNIFFDPSRDDGLSNIGRSYFAGLLAYAEEITSITNSLPISYKRLTPGKEAPTYISWDWLNRTALCRGHSKGTKKIRVEYRAPDPMCNPYFAFAAMLSAGLEGIAQNMELILADHRNLYYDNKNVKELPGNFGKALEIMRKSEMLRKRMGDFFVDNYYKMGKNHWEEYLSNETITQKCLKLISGKHSQKVTDYDIRRYF